MDKRLKKDLPFGNLKEGDVISFYNSCYQLVMGNTYYEGGGSSSNGSKVFDKTEENMIGLIWDNKEWFEDTNLKHITFQISKEKIILNFDSMSYEDVESLTKGLIHILPELEEGSYTWTKFKDITTQIKH